LVVVPAALADYTTTPEPGKISSRSRPRLSLRLNPAPKLLPLLRSLAPPPTRLVGFKLLAETDTARLRTAAEQLARESGADAIVANGVESIGNGRVRALWVTPSESRAFEGSKTELADQILDLCEPSAGSGSARPRAAAPGLQGAPGSPKRSGLRRRSPASTR
jgi:phosphopantothenoylcysteine synthetase/decarboxylase